MIIRESRDSRYLSITNAQVSGPVVLSVGWVGMFSYPLCHLTSCPSQGLEGRARVWGGGPKLSVLDPRVTCSSA